MLLAENSTGGWNMVNVETSPDPYVKSADILFSEIVLSLLYSDHITNTQFKLFVRELLIKKCVCY